MSSRAIRKAWFRLGRRMGNQLAAGAALAAVALALLGVLFYVFEHGQNENVPSWMTALKWLSLTLLTAGSPFDIKTPAGNVVYYLVLIGGLGFAAMVTGAVASKLVEFILRRSSGMGEAKVSNHIVICGWSSKGPEILRELHADEVEDKRPVVILAPLDTSPTRDEMTTFIQGTPSKEEDLLRAGIDRADTAIILADASNPAHSSEDRDAKTLMTTLAIESIAPHVYTCVEVIRSENRQHFERTKANELVVSAELTGALLAGSAVIHGLTRAVSDLLTHPEGNELYTVEVKNHLVGQSYLDAMGVLKVERDCVLIGVASDEDDFMLNPPHDMVLAKGARLLVIAKTGFVEP